MRADKMGVDKRYQIITQHEPYEMICEDTGLGFERTEKLVFIQIFQQGRSREVKEATMAELAKRLGDECGVSLDFFLSFLFDVDACLFVQYIDMVAGTRRERGGMASREDRLTRHRSLERISSFR
jgi:hypothetical protein